MICVASHPQPATPDWHQAFMALLPRICQYARFAFRHLDPEAKQEAIQNVVAGALNAYVRLVQLDKADIAYATPLAKFAIRQHRDGRRLGSRLNSRDISSPYAQKLKGIVLQRLDKYDAEDDSWQEIVIEDRHVGPDQVAATKLDFASWLRRLPRRNRRIAQFLTLGNRTGEAARKFKLSEGRISQVRRELQKAWAEFTGESQIPQAAVPA